MPLWGRIASCGGFATRLVGICNRLPISILPQIEVQFPLPNIVVL